MQQQNTGKFNTILYSPTFVFLARILRFVYIIIATAILYIIPTSLVTAFFEKFVYFFYPATVLGLHNIPTTKGALLAANHMSLIDGLLLRFILKKDIYFLVSEATFTNWFLRPWLRHFKTIPLFTSRGISQTLKSLRKAGKLVQNGELVCVFPEGHISRTGALLPFRKGLKTILKNSDAQIIPIFMDQVWGSIFSYYGGRFVTKIPPKLIRPLTIVIGEPLNSAISPAKLRLAIQGLEPIAWEQRKKSSEFLHHYFIKKMRSFPHRRSFSDKAEDSISRIGFLIRTLAVTKTMRRFWRDQKTVGIMLPTCSAAAYLNIASSIMGRTSVNLNFTAGRSALASAIRQANLKTVITARALEAKLGKVLPSTVKVFYMEDIAKDISFSEKISAVYLALFGSIKDIEKSCGSYPLNSVDDPLTIIFSSGSTGEPKGAVLSHFNILSNIQQVDQYLKLDANDFILEILPVFHSFGFLAMWKVLTMGIPTAFISNPLDAVNVGDTCEKLGVTFFFATPTFLQLYLRKCKPEQFGTVKTVITGAEKLPLRTVEAFYQKFGIWPVEGYGTTECSPVLSINIENYRAKGIFQLGSEQGSVGILLPGMAAKIVDPETDKELGFRKPGLLMVKGPNVMGGYLNNPYLNKKVLVDGWYNTGDIATLSELGFLTITDRLSRFSKIAGEMIPHGVIEDALHKVSGIDDRIFAVTGVPDERKGEVIVVLHTWPESKVTSLPAKLAETGLPNLFIPKKDFFLRVEELPLLGSGKINLKRLKEIAQEYFCGGKKFR